MNNKVVYLHRNPKTLEIYYVGMGKKTRAYDIWARNRHWINYTNKYGKPIVEIVASSLTEEDAYELEVLLIKEIGRRIKGKGTLTNISQGGCMSFANEDGSTNRKRVIHLDLGEVFDSITEAMPYIEATHNHHVSSFFKNPPAKDLRVRLIDKDNKIEWIPKFDGIYDSGHEELTGVDGICDEYNHEADYKEEELITSLNLYKSELGALEEEMLELNVVEGLSLSEISDKLGVSRNKTYRFLLESKQYIKDSVLQGSNPINPRIKKHDDPKEALLELKSQSATKKVFIVTARLSEEEYLRMKLRAEAEGKSISQLVRELAK